MDGEAKINCLKLKIFKISYMKYIEMSKWNGAGKKHVDIFNQLESPDTLKIFYSYSTESVENNLQYIHFWVKIHDCVNKIIQISFLVFDGLCKIPINTMWKVFDVISHQAKKKGLWWSLAKLLKCNSLGWNWFPTIFPWL